MFQGGFHNAKKCTIDGRDHFVAYLQRDGRTVYDSVQGFDTEAEAHDYLVHESKRRGQETIEIVDRTTKGNA